MTAVSSLTLFFFLFFFFGSADVTRPLILAGIFDISIEHGIWVNYIVTKLDFPSLSLPLTRDSAFPPLPCARNALYMGQYFTMESDNQPQILQVSLM